MKIIGLGDIHARQTIPANRIDDFASEFLRKIDFVANYAEDNAIQIVLLPGDIFHSPIQPYNLLIKMIKIMRGHDFAKVKWLAVYGQHDLLFHNKENKDVALNVLEAAKVVTICDQEPFSMNGVNIYGCSYDDEIPEIKTDGINILMIHAMVIAEKKLWKDQKDFIKSSTLLRKHKFDLIVCGDNHKGFQDNYRNRFLINCGSLMRSNIDQKNHKPCFYVYDTEADISKLKKIEIPIKPSKEVFQNKEIKKEKKVFEDKFTSQFDKEHEFTINFKKNVIKGMKNMDKKELSIGARNVIKGLFKEG